MINCLLEHKRLGGFLTVTLFQEHRTQVTFNSVKLNKSKCTGGWGGTYVESIYMYFFNIWVYLGQRSLQRKMIPALSLLLLFICDLFKWRTRERRQKVLREELSLRLLDLKTCRINITLATFPPERKVWEAVRTKRASAHILGCWWWPRRLWSEELWSGNYEGSVYSDPSGVHHSPSPQFGGAETLYPSCVTTIHLYLRLTESEPVRE